MKSSMRFLVGLLVVLLFVASMCVFTIQEGQRGIKLRLGEIVTDSKSKQAKIFNPGLHFKLPFINTINVYDVRLQTLNVESSRILTENQKYVLVDYYAKWKIADLPLYYTRTGGQAYRAQALLQQKINNALRAAFGKRTISEVVSGERLNVMNLLKDEANKSAVGLGLSVIDVRIKRIDLPKEVSESVYARMSAEREQVATKHRSDGKAQAEKIKAAADAQATVILATAKQKAAEIAAKGTKEAARVYSNAYKRDPEFYAFYRSLGIYKSTFNNKNDVIVLRPNNALFKYFNNTKKP